MWHNDPRYASGHPRWNGFASYPADRRLLNDEDFNTARGLANMRRREREEVWRRAEARVSDPYSMPRQRSRAYATMGNVIAVEDARARRHQNTGIDGVAEQMSRMNMGGRSSRGRRSDRDVRWVDLNHAPEPPRYDPRNVTYYLDRASRPQNTYQDNYNDAYRYIYGRQADHRTAPVSRHHDPREYAGLNLRFGLNGGRNHDPASYRRDRIRNWF